VREYHRHFSQHLNRWMEFLVFGSGGAPVLVFPTSRGRFYQWEDFHMLEALREPLERGWLQLFCVDSVDDETWYDFERPQSQVLAQHQRYDDYLIAEFLPFLRERNPVDFLIVAGASFGAYHAANFTFRHPGEVRRLLAMSGDFCIRKYLGEHYDLSAYYHNPVDFLTNQQSAPFRHLEVILAAGVSDFCLPPTGRLAQTLWDLGVPARLEVWGEDAVHDWPTWRRMVVAYL
jgi:esterase/lipase superfamily enzyme